MSLPFLPGNTFTDPAKDKFHVSQSLGYKNGYPLTKLSARGIGGEIHPVTKANQMSAAEFDELAQMKPTLTYGDPAPEHPVQFVPAHVAFDKRVLQFKAFFNQTVHESAVEDYRVRFVKIYYYLEDDSISVVEPVVENSGIPQGKLIKRQRLPKDEMGQIWHWKDLNLGIDVSLYGTSFHVYDCDEYTRNFMESEGMDLNPPEGCPSDPYTQRRRAPQYTFQTPAAFDKLKQFLEMDRKVLRFYCVWDDRENMFGEMRKFVLHYYMVDDSIEVLDLRQTNDGRDPYPVFLRRQRLPKDRSDVARDFPAVVLEVTDHEIADWYTPADLGIGRTIGVLGRRFLLYDCDDFTKLYYRNMFNIQDFTPIDIESPQSSLRQPELPPYNGYGTIEDSIQNCRSLIPQPPKKDFIRMLENDGKVLRFSASMVSKFTEDKNRKFIISYRLSDDMFTIYEPPQRNAGIIAGKFLERTRIKKPDCDPQKPEFYGPHDLIVGQTIDVFSHKFLIEDADEYVLKYMEERSDEFPTETIEALRKKHTTEAAPATDNDNSA